MRRGRQFEWESRENSLIALLFSVQIKMFAVMLRLEIDVYISCMCVRKKKKERFFLTQHSFESRNYDDTHRHVQDGDNRNLHQ
jgi:hypothetical protein